MHRTFSLRKRRVVLFASAAVALGLALLGFGLTRGAGSPVSALGGSEQRSEAVALAAASATPVPLSSQQSECLQARGGEPLLRRLPPFKQQALLRQIQQCVDSLNSPHVGPPPKPTIVVAQGPTPVPHPDPLHRSAGAGTIVDTGMAPMPSAVYAGQNRWYESKGGDNIIVYAGAEGRDHAQGVLIVAVENSTNPGTKQVSGATGGHYLTPEKAGAVRIVDAKGEQLTLQSASGTTFIFDVASRTFLPPPAP